MTLAKKPASPQGGQQHKSKAKSEWKSSTDAALHNGGTTATALPSVDAWARASQVALVGLFVIALLWCAYVAQPVIVPVLLAWVIATIAMPIVKLIEQHRIPRVVAALIVTVVLTGLVLSLLALLATPVTFWLSRVTELAALVKQKLQAMTQPLAVLEEIRKVFSTTGADSGPSLKVEQPSASVVTTIFSVVTPAVSQSILFVGALIFYLVYQTRLRNAAVYLCAERDARLMMLQILGDIDENMTRYFGAATLINVCLGAATVLLTWAVGLPNPLLWGVLAALLNYVPYLGPAIVVATLAVVGLVSFPTLIEGLIAPLIYVCMAALEGQFVTPAVMGRQLDLNPFAVFLAIAFCTWLWGPIGAFLAVPLLMALTVTLGRVFAEEKPDLPE